MPGKSHPLLRELLEQSESPVHLAQHLQKQIARECHHIILNLGARGKPPENALKLALVQVLHKHAGDLCLAKLDRTAQTVCQLAKDATLYVCML